MNLPLFPLGTVLFPGGWLPLQIFEVRYLDMVQRCFERSEPFGVLTLTEGHEVQQPARDGTAGFAAEAFAGLGTLGSAYVEGRLDLEGPMQQVIQLGGRQTMARLQPGQHPAQLFQNVVAQHHLQRARSPRR